MQDEHGQTVSIRSKSKKDFNDNSKGSGCGSGLKSQQLVTRRSLVRFPWCACQSVLGKDYWTPNCSQTDMLAPCMQRHQYVCTSSISMNHCKSLWTKASDIWVSWAINSFIHSDRHCFLKVFQKLPTTSFASSATLQRVNMSERGIYL